MIAFYSGLNLWGQLYEVLPSGGDRMAAIAYVGQNAADYLALEDTDTLVFDGSDSSIAQNHVDLDVIAGLLQYGVTLCSRSGLHTKMLHIGGDGDVAALAMVGSANASQHSVDSLFESAVVFDDADEVEKVRQTIEVMTAGEKPLDEVWLTRARDIPRHTTTPPSGWRPPSAPLVDPRKPLHLIMWHYGAPTAPPEVNQAVRDAAQGSGTNVEEIFVSPSRARELNIGDGVLLVAWPLSASRPRRNASIAEPSLVVRVIDTHRRRNRYWVVLASRAAFQHHPWHEVSAALEGAGWNEREGHMSDAQREAVYDLYPTGTP